MRHDYNTHTAQTTAPAETNLDRCRAALWNQQAQQLVTDDRRPQEILDSLVAADHLADAIRFFALALPKRSSIWWGTLCAWNAYGAQLTGEDLAALETTLSWLRSPGEINRRAAEAAGRKASVRRPAGALAMAAFMSGGSISRPDLPFVEPGPQATARLVAGAILLAAVLREPLQYRDHYRQYLAIGLDVAHGRLGWLTSATEPDDGLTFRVDPPHASTLAPHFSVDLHHHACQAGCANASKVSTRQETITRLKNKAGR
jgi:hypothetical protein